MKTENDILLELIDLMASNGIDECLCSYMHRETGVTFGVDSVNGNSQLSQGARSLIIGVYGMVIGQMTLGYPISQKDIEDTIDEFTDHILLCNKG